MTNSPEQRIELLLKAKRLLLEQEQSPNIVAKTLGVSLVTIYNWARKYQWDFNEAKPTSKAKKKQQVKKAYLSGQFSKDIAIEHQVSEVCVSRWATRYGWKALRDSNIAMFLNDKRSVIKANELKTYINLVHGELADIFNPIIDEFMRITLEKPG